MKINLRKIPNSIKRKYDESTYRRGIEFMVMKRAIGYFEPSKAALECVAAGKRPSKKEIRALKDTYGMMKKEKDLTPATMKCLREEWPALLKRIEKDEVTAEDKKDVKKVMLPFVEWYFSQTKQSVIEKRRLV